MCAPFFCLNMCVVTPGQLYGIFPLWGGDWVLLLQPKRDSRRTTGLHLKLRGTCLPWAPLSSLGTDLALSLLCEWSLVSSSAWMSCAVLVISLPRCSGQSVWTSVPGDTQQMPLARHSLKYVFALKLEMERLLTISVPKLCPNFLVKPNNFIYPSLIPESAINIVSSQWMVVAFFTYLSFTRLQNLVRQR